MTDPIATFKNTEANMTSFVTKHIRGFAVSLRDDDCSEFVPTVRIFPIVETAIEYAKTLAE